MPQRAVQLSFGDLTGGFQARFLDYPEAHPGASACCWRSSAGSTTQAP